MATLQLLPMTTINGTTIATAQLILQQTPSEKHQKNILPKEEPVSPSTVSQTLLTDLRSKKSPADLAKRRLHFSKKALTHPRPQSVTRRNARERNRVKQVNQGFVTLANHVPSHLRSKKMSKVDTLKAAIDYINELHDLLENVGGEVPSLQMPASPASSCSSGDSSVDSPPSAAAPTYPLDAFQPTEQYNISPQPHCQYQQQQPQYHYQHQQQYHQQQYNNNAYYNCQTAYSSDTCPSPGSTDSGYDRHEPISPEVEAEILEFASWFSQ